ncbi:MAG: Mur ligase family protein, partial [Acidobacteria bacterium]|nr:Mur ligase family protein [Acidobacteriota bacterium]
RPDLVIVGNAVPETNPEAQAVEELGVERISMPEALYRFFLIDRRPLVVAGTHGKTTTTALAAWVYRATGCDPGFLIGGAPLNFEHSFATGSGERFIVEGDEYNAAYFDRGPKFFHYRPDTLILTSVEYDHADLYETPSALDQTYRRLVRSMPANGLLIAYGDSVEVRSVAAEAPCRTLFYGFEDHCDLRPEKVVSDQRGTQFELRIAGDAVEDRIAIELPLGGGHNLLNATAVFGAACADSIPPSGIAAALAKFEGVRRRQEVVGDSGGILVIDDFAHHPTAIAGAVAAARARYPRGRIWAIVEPRSNTLRRKIFQEELKSAFEDADEVLFAPVHRAEALPNAERLDVAAVVEELRSRGKEAHLLAGVREIVSHAAERLKGGDTALIMSNGGFEGIHDLLLQALRERPSPNTPAGFASSKPASRERS